MIKSFICLIGFLFGSVTTHADMGVYMEQKVQKTECPASYKKVIEEVGCPIIPNPDQDPCYQPQASQQVDKQQQNHKRVD
jgi:hypothetical protein